MLKIIRFLLLSIAFYSSTLFCTKDLPPIDPTFSAAVIQICSRSAVANWFENILGTFEKGKFGSIFENRLLSVEPCDFYGIGSIRKVLFDNSTEPDTVIALAVFYTFVFCPLFNCRELQIRNSRSKTLNTLSNEQLTLIVSACERVTFKTSDKRTSFTSCKSKDDALQITKRMWGTGSIVFPSFSTCVIWGTEYSWPNFSYHIKIKNLALDAISILNSRGEKVVPGGQLNYEEPSYCVVS